MQIMTAANSRATGPKGIADEQVIAALRSAGGIMAHAAAQLGVDRSGLCRRVERSAALSEAFAEMKETILDQAEAVIVEAMVKHRDVGTARWYLSLKGRRRGYRRDDYICREELQQIIDAAAERGEAALVGLRAMIAEGDFG